ncbi:MAG: type II toxin-antitoxin system RelE/ParE family toxin [Propionivibrio sp.]|uniref:type II toxin-antitoxin system RelE/ParE family toxin n=1 Tax=Propionivibrio sp. TaxID=2212460 RepID=UPI001A38ED0C|nr:type II toxin-antitoxin system RelE/ParE family toxin [Propionivibrio sp.]MBL8415813.1 type II toxin-antitoxin system RelE/ParE family toxin [Propionivibrio sp.]
MKVEFSPVAKDDLLEIALYIAQDNPVRALSFVEELETQCLLLGQAAGIGAPRPELGEGVRMLPHGRYLIFYREHVSMIRNERIMHGARDIGSDDFDVTG